MTKAGGLAAALILVLGLPMTDADICAKISDSIPTLNNSSAVCDNVRTLAKCILKREGFTNPTTATGAELDAIKEQVHSSRLAGINKPCDIDYKILVNELREERSPRESKEKMSDYNVATSPEECFATFKSHDALACSEITNYLKCLLKFQSFDELQESIPNNYYEILETSLTHELALNATRCNQSIRSLYKNIRTYQSGLDYDNATTLDFCYLVFFNHQNSTCDEVALYVKCILRFPESAEFVKHTQSTFYQNTFTVQSYNNNTWCNQSLLSLYDEMSKEKNKDGDDSASSVYSFHVFTLIAFSALFVIALH